MRGMSWVLALWLAGCGGGVARTDAGDPLDGDGGARVDAGAPEDGGPAPDGGDGDGGAPGAPFTGPEGEWAFTPIEGARCGNGSTLPVLVNRAPAATDRGDVLLFLQGGGACWDTNTCFVLRSASHVEDTLSEATLRAEAPDLARTGDDPWARATWVYVPYCTGDLHAGRRVATYPTLVGGREVHHLGADNLDLILARLHATVPSPGRVWVAGISAGAYGSALNFWRVRARWPGVRVDVLADSGTLVDVAWDRWAAMKTSWDLALPPGCADCADGLSRLLPHYDATIDEPYRYALLTYDDDAVIRLYFGLSPAEFQNRLASLRAAMAETETQRSYVLAGDQHVLSGNLALQTSDGVVLGDWLAAFRDDDPTWDDAGP